MNRSSEFNFNLNSDYLNRPGGDLDAPDNITFFFKVGYPYAAGPVPIPGGLGEDIISLVIKELRMTKNSPRWSQAESTAGPAPV